jgi:hypothetical protein
VKKVAWTGLPVGRRLRSAVHDVFAGADMPNVVIAADQVFFGARLAVVFQRTLRVPDGGTYPLPPGLGRFPLYRVADHAGRVPAEWLPHGGAFIPMYQREALWLGFLGVPWKPHAVKVMAGGVNVLSGEVDDGRTLRGDPQDYLVCPEQPWLDGFHVAPGVVRQFVAMPLGAGYSVEAALTGAERVGGLRITVFEPKPGRFPDTPPSPAGGPQRAAQPAAMGLAPGGRLRQKVYPDRHGLDAWDGGNFAQLELHLVNSAQFLHLTGEPPPPTPVDARSYTEHGLPWFALYDEAAGDVPASPRLAGVPSVAARDRERGRAGPGEAPLDIAPAQVQGITPSTSTTPTPPAHAQPAAGEAPAAPKPEAPPA